MKEYRCTPGIWGWSVRVTACIAAGWLVLAAASHRAAADFFDDVGYTQLQEELGSGLPTGAGVSANQTEASNSSDYAPDTSRNEFDSKDFTFRSGASGVSSHATGMGFSFYGNFSSTAPGVTEIDLWSSDNFLGSGLLKTGSNREPGPEIRKVENHSWIGALNTPEESADALRRLDYAINRDGFLPSVGMNNGSETPLPSLLGQGYNGISVGRTDGNHSHGLTWLDGAGRIKPEIVSPSLTTSKATSRISSAAAMLWEPALGTAADHPEVIKAILMGGATKDEFAGQWDRTIRRPLDDVFGAGELNIYRSYQILAAGQQEPGHASLVDPIGWDFAETQAYPTNYFFAVPPGWRLNELSALLTWNREVVDADAGSRFDPQPSLENLDLLLLAADDLVTGKVLDLSLSLVDNVEHIYVNEDLGIGAGLGPGEYALQVVAPTDDVSYALAWLTNMELVIGDMNLDGIFDFDDVDPFVLGLIDADTYVAIYGVTPNIHGDFDGDGDQDFDDIVGFVDLLDPPPPQLSFLQAVPEPSTLLLASLALAALLGWGRLHRHRFYP
jgi:hypothetical protein